MLKVMFLLAFVVIGGGLISMVTPATSQNREVFAPSAMSVPANLPIESYQAV